VLDGTGTAHSEKSVYSLHLRFWETERGMDAVATSIVISITVATEYSDNE
jgi:hypothetical protein